MNNFPYSVFVSKTGTIMVILLLSKLLVAKTYAQDPQFSQFYAAPLYLNPAFAGSAPQHRFISNIRHQWIGLPKAFVTYAFSYDVNVPDLNSGFGMLLTTDRAGTASFRSSTMNGVYAYKVKLNDAWVLSPGIMFGYGLRTIDQSRLIMGDQLEFDSNLPSNDPDIYRIGNVHYFDLGTGMVVYNKFFWAGLSAYHMNQPNVSIIGHNDLLPVRYSFHTGARIPLDPGVFQRQHVPSLAPSILYKRQGRFDQIDLGMHFFYEPIMTGIYYRGMPFKQDLETYWSRDALIFIFGITFNSFDFGYSYDLTISRLGPGTGGSHEVSLSYRFEYRNNPNKKKKEKFIPCPTFSNFGD
jgi:type IX secretion system PorP/SprF family membrane protein